MTNRERILAVIEGREPDRIPWAPRIEVWYKAQMAQGTMPERFKGLSMVEIRRKLGLGAGLRGDNLYTQKMNGVEVVEEHNGSELKKRYITPVGEVSEVFAANPDAKGKIFVQGQLEHMIKGEADYKVVRYIFENTEYLPNYGHCAAYEQDTGDDGIAIYHNGYDPMFALLHKYIGYNQVFYELADNLDELEGLYELMCRKYKALQDIMLEAPARFIIHGTHFDSMMTPPPIFDKYIRPYLKNFSDRMHEAGKVLTVHADGDSKLLLSLFLEAGIDMVECFCTAPMVSVTFEEAVDAWGDKMVIWGGIPSTILCDSLYPYEDFVAYVNSIFDVLRRKKARVILGAADNVMPEADIGRVEKITEMVEKFRR